MILNPPTFDELCHETVHQKSGILAVETFAEFHQGEALPMWKVVLSETRRRGCMEDISSEACCGISTRAHAQNGYVAQSLAMDAGRG